MMKKIFVWLTVLAPLFTDGQVTVSAQLPPAGMIQKDQLWNLVLVNNSSQMPEITLSLDLQDAVTGQTVLSGGSRSFVFGKGVKMVSLRDLQPIQYNYMAAELTASYIPLGSYTACYRIIRNGSKGPEPLADECVRLNINPLSPPQLNTPADKSVEQTVYPQFSWLPPTPTEMFNNLNYDITVAEVLQGQTPAEAMLNNTPVYMNGNIRNPFQNYPSAYSSLQAGKQYAWQVTARNGLNYSVQTEVWSFVVKPADSIKNQPVSGGYLALQNKQDASGISYVNEGELLIKYYSYDREHVTLVRLLSADGKLVHEVKQSVAYGNNFLRFKLGHEFKKGTVYMVELTDQQNNIYSTKFSIL